MLSEKQKATPVFNVKIELLISHKSFTWEAYEYCEYINFATAGTTTGRYLNNQSHFQIDIHRLGFGPLEWQP